jgi:hypothetical protein
MEILVFQNSPSMITGGPTNDWQTPGSVDAHAAVRMIDIGVQMGVNHFMPGQRCGYWLCR